MTADLSQAHAGDFLLIHETGWQAAVIQAVTHGRWNHVACVGDGCLIEALDRGVARSPVEKYVNADARLVTVPLDDAQRATAAAFLSAAVGDHYDWLNIGEFAIDLISGRRIVLGEEGRYICSALAGSALKAAGYPLPADPRLLSPNGLARAFGIATEG